MARVGYFASAVAAENLATNLRVLEALVFVHDLLGNLAPVVFKGPLLTQRIYGDLGARASADNDLWVRREVAGEALGRLLAAGYQPEPGIDPEERLFRVGQVALWPHGDPAAVSVDLHLRPFRAPYFHVSEEVLTRHLCEVRCSARTFLSFDDQLALCHLAAHYVQHHLEDALTQPIGRLYDRLDREGRRASWALATETGTREALWLALGRDEVRRDYPDGLRVSARARWVAVMLPPPSAPRPRELLRKAYALLVAGVGAIGPGLLEGALPSGEELRYRYGNGSRLRLTLGHIRRVARGR